MKTFFICFIDFTVMAIFATAGAFVLWYLKPLGPLVYVVVFVAWAFLFGEISWRFKNWIHGKIKGLE